MPTMPRPKGKAKKIAYMILGKPLNLVYDKRPWSQKIDERLIFEETTRAK